MNTASNNVDTIDYRLAMIDSSSGRVMTLAGLGRCALPRVTIPKWNRVAEEINDAIYKRWHLKTAVLSFLPSGGESPSCAVAEIISSANPYAAREMILQPPDAIDELEFVLDERDVLTSIMAGSTSGPFARLGWFVKMQEWVQRSVTERVVEFTGDFRQYNASDTFSLVRLDSTNGERYWFKATGSPNRHECPVTAELSRRFPGYLPSVIAVHEEWNAWVTEDAGRPLGGCEDLQIMSSAVSSLAELQKLSLGSVDALRTAGCLDRSLSRLRLHLVEMFSFLEETMRLQTSKKVEPVTSARLMEIATTVGWACDRMQELEIPECLVNGDINLDNILFDGETFRFTDWAEAGIGNPFLTLQQIIQHVTRDGDHLEWASCLCRTYKEKWQDVLEERQIDEAISIMPLLAMADYLYGRGTWLCSSRRDEPSFQRFARTLARCMDRAVQELSAKEVAQL